MAKQVQHIEGTAAMINIDDKVLKLSEVVTGEDKMRLFKLQNAVATTFKEYDGDYSVSKLSNYRAAEKARNSVVDDLWPKYFPSDIRLRYLKDIVEYLQSMGYKIGKSSVDNHIKQGKLTRLEDGTFSARDVEKYAATFIKNRTTPPSDAATGESQMDIARAEYDKLCKENELLDIKIAERNGALVPRSHFEHEIAARAQILRLDAESFARGNAQAIIALVKGDETMTAELVAFLLAEVETWFARYTDQEYQAQSIPALAAPDTLPPPDLEEEED